MKCLVLNQHMINVVVVVVIVALVVAVALAMVVAPLHSDSAHQSQSHNIVGSNPRSAVLKPQDARQVNISLSFLSVKGG